MALFSQCYHERGLPDASISTLYGVGVPVFTQAGLSVVSVYTRHGVDFQAGLSVASVYTGYGVDFQAGLSVGSVYTWHGVDFQGGLTVAIAAKAWRSDYPSMHGLPVARILP